MSRNLETPAFSTVPEPRLEDCRTTSFPVADDPSFGTADPPIVCTSKPRSCICLTTARSPGKLAITGSPTKRTFSFTELTKNVLAAVVLFAGVPLSEKAKDQVWRPELNKVELAPAP